MKGTKGRKRNKNIKKKRRKKKSFNEIIKQLASFCVRAIGQQVTDE